MLSPILAFCAAGVLAVAATVALGAFLAKRHNRAMAEQTLREIQDDGSGRDAGPDQAAGTDQRSGAEGQTRD